MTNAGVTVLAIFLSIAIAVQKIQQSTTKVGFTASFQLRVIHQNSSQDDFLLRHQPLRSPPLFSDKSWEATKFTCEIIARFSKTLINHRLTDLLVFVPQSKLTVLNFNMEPPQYLPQSHPCSPHSVTNFQAMNGNLHS